MRVSPSVALLFSISFYEELKSSILVFLICNMTQLTDSYHGVNVEAITGTLFKLS